MAAALVRMVSGTANIGWENYHEIGEHMLIENLFLNNFIKIVNFIPKFVSLMTIPDAWISDNQESTVVVVLPLPPNIA
jgi:hypothetical protein